ncbi:MAG: hypothetical protein V4508_18550 [Pseudomonadota bacterium]
MKKIATLLIVFLFAVLAWNVFGHADGAALSIDGERIDGPLGALAALALAGGGLVIGTVALLFVALVLAVVFAGVGILMVGALVLAALIVAALVSPLLLPLLLPLGLIWLFTRRNRRQRMKADAV